jgi:hypothetical protein
MNSFVPVPDRDVAGATSPIRCPICGVRLSDVQIRDIGGITADLTWQVHAGYCDEHGWFQAEIISQPPRELFPVTRPFGVARRVVVDGDEVYSFSTVWNDVSSEMKRSRVDPLDPQYWQVRRQVGQSS